MSKRSNITNNPIYLIEKVIFSTWSTSLIFFMLAISMFIYYQVPDSIIRSSDMSSGVITLLSFSIILAVFAVVLTFLKDIKSRQIAMIVMATLNLLPCLFIFPIFLEVITIIAILKIHSLDSSYKINDDFVKSARKIAIQRFLFIPMFILLPIFTFSIGNSAGRYSSISSNEEKIKSQNLESAINGLKMGYGKGYEDGKNCVLRRAQDIAVYGDSNINNEDCYNPEFR